jgi:hypothetical protein
MRKHPVTIATKKAALFAMLGKRWMTHIDALSLCGIATISQRVSEWRAAGHTIVDKWVQSNGARFKSYRLVKPTKWTA